MKNFPVVELAWGAGVIALALAATLAKQLGLIDQDTVLRLVLGSNGLMIAHFGNRAPKKVAPSAVAQQIARVSGWSFVLSGLAYTGLWIFAPIQLAISLGVAIIASGIIVTMAYCWRLRGQIAETASRHRG